MKITVNNTAVEIPEGTTVSQIAVSNGCAGGKGTAIAVNGKICRLPDWETTPLEENDNIVIIKAAYGG